MPDEPVPPPIVAPPVDTPSTEEQFQRPPNGGHKKSGAKAAGGVGAALLALLAKLKTVGTLLLSLLKFAKLGKIALTGGTMLLSIWIYAQWFGAWFAVGFVILIFVHEMGHVLAAYKLGIPVSAPIFIPGMGALILTKKFGGVLKTHDAIVGIGGPAMGTLGSVACVGLYMATGSLLLLALAYFGFFINLFNLTPVYPLDGGWIVRAISPLLWLVGTVILVYLTITGQIRNPLVFVLVILGIPTMWSELSAYFKRAPSQVPSAFRWQMGAAYLALIFICAGSMVACRNEIEEVRTRNRPARPAGSTVAMASQRVDGPERD